MASGTSKKPTVIENTIRRYLQSWTFVQDPCYTKDDQGNVRLWDECEDLV